MSDPSNPNCSLFSGMTMPDFERLTVHTKQGEAGELRRQTQYVFRYTSSDPRCEIGLALPLSVKGHLADTLPGVLRQNLPEGFLKDRLSGQHAGTLELDAFNTLALTGRHGIGRVGVKPAIELEQSLPESEDLAELLAWQGTDELFESLLDSHAGSSAVSGVQPKVLVEEKPVSQASDSQEERAHRSLIVKTAGKGQAGLAENEFHCMSIARQAGLLVPEFWLSQDKGLYIISRFDRPTPQQWLGFEDMAALTGRQNEEKYRGSYEMVAHAIERYASPRYIASSLEEFFKSLVISIVLRNGDAHLKNFGLLYTDPTSDDVRLSPQFDIVNTTSYQPDQLMALRLAGTRDWPQRKALLDFGKNVCRVDKANELIEMIVDTAANYSPEIETGEIWERMQMEVDRGCLGFM